MFKRSFLIALASVLASSFTAVGSEALSAGSPFATRSTGSGVRCQLVTVPQAGSSSELVSVAQASAGNAMAAGFSSNGSSTLSAFAVHWNGSGWSDAGAQGQPGYADDFMSGVSAIPGTTSYWAVGTSYNEPFPTYYAIIDLWTGSCWLLLSNPPHGWLNAVSAQSASVAWAVGFNEPPSGTFPVALRFNGSSWESSKLPTPAGTDETVLQGVDVVKTRNVWAVGYYASGSNQEAPLIEHWTGKKWSIVRTPAVGAVSALLGVSHAAGGRTVWAVGGTANSSSGTLAPLIEVWDGSAWTVVPPAASTDSYAVLNTVAAIRPDDVWAGGYHIVAGSSHTTPLLEHWEGKSWKMVRAADPAPNADTYLGGVAGLAGIRSVFAVGTYGTPTSSFGETCI